MANKKSWFVRHKYGIIFSKTLDKLYIKKYNKDVETKVLTFFIVVYRILCFIYLKGNPSS